MNQKIKVAVVDDHSLVRESLVNLLKVDNDMSVVFEAGNGRELLDHLKFKQVDIVLLDYNMPVMNGLEALEIIKKRFPEIKVIMVTMCTDNMTIAECMTLGANSYVSKGSNIEYLLNAIKIVYKEDYHFDNITSKALLTGLVKDKALKQLLNDVEFNEKELKVLKLICDGKTTKEISVSSHMAISTVDLYRSRIYSKAKCSNVALLMKFAIRKGLITVN